MTMKILLPASLVLLGLAGCMGPVPTGTEMTHSTAPNTGSQVPQPANSLPPGTAVNAPVTSGTGTVGTTATSPRRY